jgi:hypothetical protein
VSPSIEEQPSLLPKKKYRLYYADWSSVLIRATGTRREATGEAAAIIDCVATIQETADTVDIVEDMSGPDGHKSFAGLD